MAGAAPSLPISGPEQIVSARVVTARSQSDVEVEETASVTTFMTLYILVADFKPCGTRIGIFTIPPLNHVRWKA